MVQCTTEAKHHGMSVNFDCHWLHHSSTTVQQLFSWTLRELSLLVCSWTVVRCSGCCRKVGLISYIMFEFKASNDNFFSRFHTGELFTYAAHSTIKKILLKSYSARDMDISPSLIGPPLTITIPGPAMPYLKCQAQIHQRRKCILG